MNRPPENSVLDRRTLNRTLLARQGLLERRHSDVTVMIEQLVALQAQVPRDPFVSLWSRIDGFDPAGLDALLLERRAVRLGLLRGTIHLATVDDAFGLWPAMADVARRSFASSGFAKRIAGLEIDEVVRLGLGLLEANPLTISELGAALAERWPDRDPDALGYCLRYHAPLVQVTPRGLWEGRAAARLTSLQVWTGRSDDDRPIDEFVLRYLRAFGPATTADIRTWSWLVGVREIVERLGPELCTYRDESGRLLLDVADGEFEAPDTPAPVRFLGEYDNVFLSHADRTRITGDLSWGTHYARWGAFFVDGFLAGRWRFRTEPTIARLEVEPARPLDPSARADVAAEAEALAAFLAPEGSAPQIAITA